MPHRIIVFTAMLVAAGVAAAQPVPSPADRLGPLFAAVQQARVFADSKTFADAVPRRDPAAILGDWRRTSPTGPALAAFVAANFAAPPAPPPVDVPAGLPLADHIAALWPLLTRQPAEAPRFGSLLPLAHAYVVPGGRFREIYYWDSYFTLLGVVRDGRTALAQGMVDDFTDLIERYGHIPNGTRSYYLSRSQPPFYFAMVALAGDVDAATRARRLRAMRSEHAFWMAGAAGLKPGEAARRVVRLTDGSLLNRYWDDRDTPRDEAFREDVATATASGRPPPAVYRDLRAAAESGWDFSSRWLGDGRTLATVRTTAIVPVDLNSLLYGLERAIADGCAAAGDRGCAAAYRDMATQRRVAMSRHLWDAAAGRFADLDRDRGLTPIASAAAVYPLFTGVATSVQAAATAAFVRQALLAPGGLRTTLASTGQQWDAPNGWAPLQWLAVAGLDRYGDHELADTIGARWLATVEREYGASGRLLEKYNVETATRGGGGEYPLQDGFGWTNGVTR
ncbi:MAG: alpha,alpha-trehalase TreF, partial [Sphingomonadaceae bacterium]|nr:alpha,alpha-trehalase TreF [Sphingomonadaceae bacterium]